MTIQVQLPKDIKEEIKKYIDGEWPSEQSFLDFLDRWYTLSKEEIKLIKKAISTLN
jgi:hypothetical protein